MPAQVQASQIDATGTPDQDSDADWRSAGAALDSESPGTIASRMVNPIAVKTAFPDSAHPCAAPENSAEERPAGELPRSKHPAGEQTGFKAPSVPLTFEQRGAPVDCIGSEPFSSVQFTGPQN